MMKLIIITILLSISQSYAYVSFGACPKSPILANFNTKQYAGVWYEIERFPSWFESDLSCVTATYNYTSPTSVTVRNAGVKLQKNNQTSGINGNANVVNPAEPNKLIVTFPIQVLGFTLFSNSGNYHVWATDFNSYALVFSCSDLIPNLVNLKTAWILSRTKTLDAQIVAQLKSQLTSAGIDVSKFEKVQQICSN